MEPKPIDPAKWKQWLDRGKPSLALKRLREALVELGWQDLEAQAAALLSQLNNSQEETARGMRTGGEHAAAVQKVTQSARGLLSVFEERQHRLETEGNWVGKNDLAINLFLRAQREMASENWKEAIELLSQITEEAPLFTEAFVERGVAYASQKPPDYPAALKDFEAALRVQADHPFALLNRGILYYKYLGDSPQACEDWQKAYEQGLEEALIYLKKFCNA